MWAQPPDRKLPSPSSSQQVLQPALGRFVMGAGVLWRSQRESLCFWAEIEVPQKDNSYRRAEGKWGTSPLRAIKSVAISV